MVQPKENTKGGLLMAHTCPVCGITCHCNGDIDDLCLDFEDDVMACDHCEEYEEEEAMQGGISWQP